MKIIDFSSNHMGNCYLHPVRFQYQVAIVGIVCLPNTVWIFLFHLRLTTLYQLYSVPVLSDDNCLCGSCWSIGGPVRQWKTVSERHIERIETIRQVYSLSTRSLHRQPRGLIDSLAVGLCQLKLILHLPWPQCYFVLCTFQLTQKCCQTTVIIQISLFCSFSG